MATALATPTQTSPRLAGPRRAAILLTSLGEDAGASILRNLREQEVHDIMLEITRLSTVTEQQREAVLKEFGDAMGDPLQLTSGGFECAQNLLVTAFGPESGQQMAERLSKKANQEEPDLSALRKADPQRIARLVSQEQPQAIALVLSQLPPAQGGEMLSALPAEIRTPVARRFATLDRVSPDVLARIAGSLGSKLKVAGESEQSCGGAAALAEILNRADTDLTQTVLNGISSDDPTLAESIRSHMFVFDDLLQVPADAMREIIRRIDRKVMTLALKGSGPELRGHFAKFMSSRAAEMLNEDMQALGAVRLRDVEAAQQQVIGTARQLQNEGVIRLKPEAADRMVE